MKLLNSWIKEAALHNIAFKAIIIMRNLLLQKPSKNSKAKDHLTALERRILSWFKGDLMKLLHEGERIQKNLTHKLTKGEIGTILKKLAALIWKGDANAAINLLTGNMRNGILSLNNKTLNLFRLKHLDPKDAYESVMLSDVLKRKQLVKFEVIDTKIIREAGMKTRNFCYQGIFVSRFQNTSQSN